MKKMQRQSAGKNAGFTLIEIMAVVLIIGLLIATVGGPIARAIFTGTETRVKADIKNLETSIDLYRQEFRRFPGDLNELTTPDRGPAFLNVLPLDPWGNEYFYEAPQSGDEYVIGTYGRDGSQGGEGEDADITNLTIKERK
jgi:general secretion pathway protein G